MTHRFPPITLHGYGKFHSNKDSWTSDLACAKVRYNPSRKKIIFLKIYGQKSKNPSTNHNYVKPWFPDETIENWLSYLDNLYEKWLRNGCKFVDKPNDRSGPSHNLKNHQNHLCERCTELGRSCVK